MGARGWAERVGAVAQRGVVGAGGVYRAGACDVAAAYSAGGGGVG